MVTLKDIAKIAGVNYSTVSRSLNDSPEISIKTKERIKKIAEELGFEFNSHARSLSTKKTGTLGIIFDKTFDEENASFFFSKLLKAIRYGLEKESLDVILDFRTNPFTGKSNLKKLINARKIDGLIIVDAFLTKEDIAFINEKDVPVVFVHNKPPSHKKYKLDYVLTDHFAGGYLATKYLVQEGHKDIITFTHKKYNDEYSEFEERTKGFVKALEEEGFNCGESVIIRDEISFDYGRNKIRDLIKKKKKFTAVFAQTDLVALGIIRGIKEEGLKIPQDISVVGYDNIEFGRVSEPELSTINQPIGELVEEAVKILMKKLKKGYESQEINLVIEPELIIRNSVGRVKE